jgi:small subunit ribosomal protein S7
MPRKGPAERRPVPPDPVFGSRMASMFISRLLRRGKRSRAEQIFYGALARVHERTGRDPLEVLEQAMRAVMPVLEVRPRRVGGATYQVPMEVRPSRKLALGITWLVGTAETRSGRTMAERLAAELMDAAGGTGASVKKREDTHKMAEANKAFAHYRW